MRSLLAVHLNLPGSFRSAGGIAISWGLAGSVFFGKGADKV